MKNLSIKGIADDVYADFRRLADEQNLSINGLVQALIRDAVSDYRRREKMRANREVHRRFLDSLPLLEGSTASIREDRER